MSSTNTIVNGGSSDGTSATPMNVFVAKFNSAGERLWTTIIGGPNYDRAYAIEVDSSGNSYVAGRAGANFPVTSGAMQTSFQGGKHALYGNQDGFVLKLNPSGTALVWSTYFGGNDDGFNRDIDIDSSGNVYVAAVHRSGTSYPSSIQSVFNSGPYPTPAGGIDAVVAKINAAGSTLLWAMHLGGTLNEAGENSIRVDSNNNPVILTTTASMNAVTTAGAYDRTFNGNRDFYLAKVQSNGSGLIFATYLGGSAAEVIETKDLAIDNNDNIFVGGGTLSTNFPMVGAYDSSYNGSGGSGTGGGTNYAGDGILAKLSSDGTQLLASTYLGGRYGDQIEGIFVDGLGSVYVSGGTYSDNFPVSANGYQRTRRGPADGFVAKLSNSLNSLSYSSFVGGNGIDYFRCIAVDGSGNFGAGGETKSSDFPLRSAFQSNYIGATDGAFVKFSTEYSAPPCTYTLSATQASVGAGASSGYTVGVTAGSGCAWTASSNAGWISITGNGTVTYSVQANTGGSRQGTMTIAGQTFTVTQAGTSGGESWYNHGWSYRKAITIQASQVSGGTHSNFPVLVKLNSDADLAALARNDGGDILFTLNDHATKLDHEIESFSGYSTGELAAWVRLPTLSNTANTTIYMYYGNAGASNQQNRNGVWNAKTSCTASNDWSGQKTASGGSEQRTGMPAGGYIFDIACSRSGLAGGTDSVTVVVSPAGSGLNTYHVSKSGNDNNSGTQGSPFLTISKGAAVAQPGDTVLVHAGIYREHVKPARSGTAQNPITYAAAPGEQVDIRGSEVITGWSVVSGNTWKVTLSGSLFGSYNPYAQTIPDLKLADGSARSKGDVFLNGIPLAEMGTTNVSSGKWAVAADGITLYANFGGTNPNNATVEASMREVVFAPTIWNLKYITVRGFNIRHSANNYQRFGATIRRGMVSTNGGYSWIIEDNIITYAHTVGIDFGLVGPGAGGGGVGTKPANFGHHLIRNNTISYAGTTGMNAYNGAFTEISGNAFIRNNRYNAGAYGGGGMRTLEATIDILLKGNYFYENRGYQAMGFDWGQQGVRITGNTFVNNSQFLLEAAHGPTSVDNNVFINTPILNMDVSCVSYTNNLFYSAGIPKLNKITTRNIPYYGAHSVNIIKKYPAQRRNIEFYLNMFLVDGVSLYSGSNNFSNWNVFYDGATKTGLDANSITSGQPTNFSFTANETGASITFNVDNAPFSVSPSPVPTTNACPLIGQIRYSGQTHSPAGPFTNLNAGANSRTLFTVP